MKVLQQSALHILGDVDALNVCIKSDLEKLRIDIGLDCLD